MQPPRGRPGARTRPPRLRTAALVAFLTLGNAPVGRAQSSTDDPAPAESQSPVPAPNPGATEAGSTFLTRTNLLGDIGGLRLPGLLRRVARLGRDERGLRQRDRRQPHGSGLRRPHIHESRHRRASRARLGRRHVQRQRPPDPRPQSEHRKPARSAERQQHRGAARDQAVGALACPAQPDGDRFRQGHECLSRPVPDPGQRELRRAHIPGGGHAVVQRAAGLPIRLDAGRGISNPSDPDQRVGNETILGLRTNAVF